MAAKEPVLASHAALWVLAVVGEALVGHGIVTDTQWTSWQSILVPVVTTAILAASAWLTRSKVTPVAHVAGKVVAGIAADIGTAEQALAAADAIYPAPAAPTAETQQ